jgi:FMN reductase
MSEPPIRIAVLSAGISDPSSTRLLAARVAQKTQDTLQAEGLDSRVNILELAPLAVDVARAIVTGLRSEALEAAIAVLADADAVIAATPVYKAGISGLFKSFVDLLDEDVMIAKPAILAATAESLRHAMVVDDQLRPLFAFMRALSVPTSIFAASDDWGSTALGSRIERAAVELAQLLVSRVGAQMADAAWRHYRHRFAGSASRAEQTAADLDFSTDLMRLATGGSADTAA